MVVPGRPGSPTAAQRFFANPSAMQDRTPTRSADMVDKSELSGHKKLPVGLLEIPEKYPILSVMGWVRSPGQII